MPKEPAGNKLEPGPGEPKEPAGNKLETGQGEHKEPAWKEKRKAPGRNTEAIKVMETYTRELKMSGYSRMEIKEILTSGIKGVKSKMERRKQQGRMYRNAKAHWRQDVRKY